MPAAIEGEFNLGHAEARAGQRQHEIGLLALLDAKVLPSGVKRGGDRALEVHIELVGAGFGLDRVDLDMKLRAIPSARKRGVVACTTTGSRMVTSAEASPVRVFDQTTAITFTEPLKAGCRR